MQYKILIYIPEMYNALLCWHSLIDFIFINSSNISNFHHLNCHLFSKFDYKRNYLKSLSDPFSQTMGLPHIWKKIVVSLALIAKPKQDIALTNTIIIVSHPNYEAQEYNHHYIELLIIFSQHLAFVKWLIIKCAYFSPKFNNNS